MEAMTIGRLANAAGVGVETVRYYQRRGLIEAPDVGSGPYRGVRRYNADHLRRLRFIRSAQAAGFTLGEIGELLALDASEDRPRALELARERLAALDAKIAELETARASLSLLARECGDGAMGPCPIIAAFESRGDQTRR